MTYIIEAVSVAVVVVAVALGAVVVTPKPKPAPPHEKPRVEQLEKPAVIVARPLPEKSQDERISDVAKDLRTIDVEQKKLIELVKQATEEVKKK